MAARPRESFADGPNKHRSYGPAEHRFSVRALHTRGDMTNGSMANGSMANGARGLLSVFFSRLAGAR